MQNLKFSQSIYVFVLIFCIMAVISAAYFAYYIFKQNSELENETLQLQGRKVSAAFDQELQVQEVTLRILSAEAESVMAGKKAALYFTSVDLVPYPKSAGFTLKVPAGMTENQVGNLTGLGTIPLPKSALAREMDMALSLSPLFEEVINNNSSLPWVYYTSVNRFAYMYPRVPPSDFFFSDELLKKEFFTIATPEHDPNRNVVWSPLYNDAAGEGMMVTISKPIYEKDDFRGVLSIDIGISDLNWLLESNAPGNATAYLVGPQGELIAGLGNQPPPAEVVFAPFESVKQVEGRSYLVFPIEEMDWHVVFDLDNGAIRLSALNKSSYVGVIFLFVIFSVLLILIVTRAMRSMQFLAVHDNLTGALNQRAYAEISLSAIQKTAPQEAMLGMIIVDVDLFKKFNDTYGHQAGDNALRRIVSALKSCLRKPGDQVFRIGGEEFAILLIVRNEDEFRRILERLIESVREMGIPHKVSPHQVVTISAGGVAVSLAQLQSVEEMYRSADRLLYSAKAAGRNCGRMD